MLHMFIYIYIYSYMKNLLPGINAPDNGRRRRRLQDQYRILPKAGAEKDTLAQENPPFPP